MPLSPRDIGIPSSELKIDQKITLEIPGMDVPQQTMSQIVQVTLVQKLTLVREETFMIVDGSGKIAPID